jgi:hypothetical protein
MNENKKNIKNNSVVQQIINSIEGEDLKFTPKNSFYSATSINSKRFAKILRNEISPTVNELKAICLYFEVDIKDYIS